MVKQLKQYLDQLELILTRKLYTNFGSLSSDNQKKLVKFLPSISFALGALCLIGAYSLWRAAQSLNSLINYSTTNGHYYGVPAFQIGLHKNLFFWLSILLLLYEAYLFIRAISLVKRHLLTGWNLIYYAFVVNVVYGIAMLFSYYGGIDTLLIRLVVSLVCLYYLFAIKDYYHTTARSRKTKVS